VRAASVAVWIAAGLALVACGGPEGEVGDTIKAYADAVADGDGRKACALLTRSLRDDATVFSGMPCEAAVAGQVEDLTPAQRGDAKIDAFKRIEIDGRTAKAEVADYPVAFELEKTAAGWRISDIGSTAP
jgi:hypothetical protein